MDKKYKDSFKVYELPYIEMYGGETIKWEIDVVDDNGVAFSDADIAGCEATLTLTPFKTTSGIGGSAILPPVSLKKTAYIRINDNGDPVIVFSFYEEDTSALRGKYSYQIDIRFQSNLRISQGCLYIKQNNNRSNKAIVSGSQSGSQSGSNTTQPTNPTNTNDIRLIDQATGKQQKIYVAEGKLNMVESEV